MFTKLIEKFTSKKSTSANETIKSDSSNEKKGAVTYQYKNTSLWIRGDEENGYFITLGNYRITEPKETMEDCEKLIRHRDIELIIGIIQCTIEYNKKYEALSKTQTETMEKGNNPGIPLS